MRFSYGLVYALALLVMSSTADDAFAVDILASVFDFGTVPEDDPNPNLSGIIKIDSDTGVASPFIPSGTGQASIFSDVAVGPHDGLIYAATQVGQIARFDAAGNPLGAFAFFPLGEESVDGVNTLRFAPDGTLYTATGSGVIAKFDPSGNRQPDVATGLTFPSGIALGAGGDLYVATGDAGGAGSVFRINDSGMTTVIDSGVIGGASGVTYLPAKGDYNEDNINSGEDRDTWASDYGSVDSPSDGTGDGVVNAADYTIWRDNQGDHAQLLIPDFTFASSGNRIFSYDLIDETGSTLTTIPVDIPDPLEPPPTAFPTNFPSEVLVTPSGSLLVSSLGPSQRPLNRGSLIELNADGSLIQIIQTSLPPLSGIALAPPIASQTSVPEPSTLLLTLATTLLACRGRNSR